MALNAFEIKGQKLRTKLYRLRNSRQWGSIKEVENELDSCIDLVDQLIELHQRSN